MWWVPDSFKRLKDLLCLQDGWHATFPDTRVYTCVQHRTNRQTNELHDSYSRLDRICVINWHFQNSRGWEITQCPISSDHRLIITKFTCRPEEQPGTGRWSMPLYLLKTRKFMKRVQALAVQLLKDLDSLQLSERDETKNIQTLWAKFKWDIIAYGKHCSRFILNESKYGRRS
ncbi:hypothetical protein C8R44DRAFT_652979 [Mycena epipterygia]|nr:hypothetical protein C8R44DRAFT_652979 [Mycena epipterygia]